MTAKRFANDHELPPDLASAWRADAMRSSECPEEFWRGQQIRIHSHIESRNVRKPRGLWLAAATAALIFFAILLIAPTGPRPTPAPQTKIDADQQLLLAIEHSLAAGTPEALEPLTLLVESSSANNEADTISHKEHGHEN